MQTLTAPQGTFNLQLFPVRPKETLRAWDAADEYLLAEVAEMELDSQCRILLLNDSFGALSCALSPFKPVSISDSYIAQQATLANLALNHISAEQITLRHSLEPAGDKGSSFDLVLLKVTKSLAQLEDQLHRIRPYLHPHTRVIAGGMVKSIHTSTLKLFEALTGPTRTSLARKKARLIFCDPDLTLQPPQNSYPRTYQLEGSEFQITNHANVFSREKLDIGTRFFIQHLPDDDRYENIIDLGCGNGVVGLIAAEKNPAAKLHFADESYMAVASAEANFRAAWPDRDAGFTVTDCLRGYPSGNYDLILNNPPFHQQNTVGDFIAWQMFRESHRVLQQHGALWVIGNRHLGYHVKLKRLFGNCQTIASNNKFVILKAIKR